MSSLFDYAETRGLPTPDMHRKRDHDTSIDAANQVAKCKTERQAEVLAAFTTHGAMTDGEMEKLPQFATWKASTARKRRGELCEAGKIVETGERRAGMKVWRIKIETGESNANGNT